MHAKVEEFNVILTNKMNTMEPGVSDDEFLNTTKNKYRKHHNMQDFRYRVA